MAHLVDRDLERQRLATLLAAGTPKLVLMYGRRRVGKTYLLANAWETDERVFYFTAAETTPGQNRRALVEDIQRFTGETLADEDFGTWRNVFRHLIEMDGTGPLVVVLDEFQYLGGGSEEGLRDVSSQLNAVWEAKRPKRPLVFILCGSSVRLLEALNDSGSPLYGRFEWNCQLEPFNYWHTAAMAPFSSLRDRALTYGIFGGTPRYLASIDTQHSLAWNVAKLCLDRNGTVRQLVETAVQQEQGLRDHVSYNAILRAIGAGNTELNRIQQDAAIERSDLTATRDKIERLMALGLVRRERNFGAKNTQPFRYRIADPALAFHHEFVTRLESTLEHYDARRVYDAHIAKALDTYMGHAFEQIAQQGYRRLQPLMKLPMDREWGRWEGKDRQKRSIAIDVVTRLADGRMMTGGIKWSTTPIAASWHAHHLDCLRRLADAGQAWAHEALKPTTPILWVSAAGFRPGFADVARASHANVIVLTLRDLYRTKS